MYSNISNDAKAALKAKAITTTARITLTSNNQVIDGNNLITVTITDQCYENGVIVGTAMCKEVEIELIDNNYDLADKEFSLEVGILLPNSSYEYIPYGNFIVKEYKKIISSNHYRLIAYDYMDKFNPTFIDNIPTLEDGVTYTNAMTLQTFYEYVANQYGVTVETQANLPNANFSITKKPYFEGMSGRVVLSRIAEMMGCFAKINRNNKLEMRLKNTTSEQFSRSEMNNSLERDNKFGPINVIALRLSQIEGENVTKRDESSITQYGETTLQIQDNPFIDTEALRLAAIDDIYDQVDGFSYYPTSFNGKLIYLDTGDEVEVQDMTTDTYYKTIILKQVINIPSIRNSRFENKALTDTGLQYQYTSEQVRKDKRTEYVVDKQKGMITQIVEQIGDRSQKTTTITQDIDGLNSKVEDIEDLTNIVAGIKTVTISDAYPNENFLELHIYGNNEVFDYLYPADDLYPSDTLYPYGDSRIRFYNDVEDKTIELGIDEALRANDEVKDEVFIDKNQVYLIRRVNANGTTKSQEVKTLLGTLDFILREGSNTFEIVNYSAPIEIKYAIKNDFTKLFATKVEMNSSITQTANEINLEVSKKLDEEDFNGAEIILAINEDDTGSVLIKGDKIDIDGKAVHFKTNINEILGPYTSTDIDRIINIIMGTITPTSSDFEKYDIDGTGQITATDLIKVRKAVNENNGYIVGEGTFEINPYSIKKTLAIWNNSLNDYAASLSIFGGYFNQLSTKNISIEDNNKSSNINSVGFNFSNNSNSDFIEGFIGGSYNDVESNTFNMFSSNGLGTSSNITMNTTKNGLAEIALYGTLNGHSQTVISHKGITTPTLTQTSREESKKNFKKLQNGLAIIKNTDIYKYNLKGQEDGDKKHIGFVIGENFKYSHEITAENEKGEEIGVDTYSMISVAYKAIQEQQEQIEQLQKEINKLKGEK